jgi:hypothetical protein
MEGQIISSGTLLVSPQPSDVHQSADQIVQFAEVNVKGISSLQFIILVNMVKAA